MDVASEPEIGTKLDLLFPCSGRGLRLTGFGICPMRGVAKRQARGHPCGPLHQTVGSGSARSRWRSPARSISTSHRRVSACLAIEAIATVWSPRMYRTRQSRDAALDHDRIPRTVLRPRGDHPPACSSGETVTKRLRTTSEISSTAAAGSEYIRFHGLDRYFPRWTVLPGTELHSIPRPKP